MDESEWKWMKVDKMDQKWKVNDKLGRELWCNFQMYKHKPWNSCFSNKTSEASWWHCLFFWENKHWDAKIWSWVGGKIYEGVIFNEGLKYSRGGRGLIA